jgi:alpha(1,3/1,4) fucosyltransferase
LKIKINFCDFWPGFEANNLLLRFLEKHFDVCIDDNPDYLFFSVYGNSHLKFKNCIKIQFTGENLVPDFNLCDYALGFHYIEFGDRYLRFPLYVYYYWHHTNYFSSGFGNTQLKSLSDVDLVQRKFCNFVYSNNVNSDPAREDFFHLLSKYKKVDSGGKHLNNISRPVVDKLQFIKDYKFSIAFENSSVPGYTTEKLLEPLIANSLPIYFGNPLVHLDFNTDSFIHVKDIYDFERAIDEIMVLDKNDELYLEKIRQPKFRNENNMQDWESRIFLFLSNIFNQSISTAFRRPDFGFTRFYLEELKLKSELLEERRRKNYFKAKIKIFLSKHLKG